MSKLISLIKWPFDALKERQIDKLSNIVTSYKHGTGTRKKAFSDMVKLIESRSNEQISRLEKAGGFLSEKQTGFKRADIQEHDCRDPECGE